MSELLAREITAEEEEAVAAVWRQEARPGLASRAHRLFREAYDRFRDGNTNRTHHWAVRFATARRWTLAAAALARHGHYIEAVLHLTYGIRWHPLGVFASVSHLARRSINFFRSAAVREELRFGWTEQARSASASV
jgi:hypothetical protein